MTLSSSSVQQQRAEVVLSLWLVTVYFSSGLRTKVGTILKLSTIEVLLMYKHILENDTPGVDDVLHISLD